jgi:hypothetical protein
VRTWWAAAYGSHNCFEPGAVQCHFQHFSREPDFVVGQLCQDAAQDGLDRPDGHHPRRSKAGTGVVPLYFLGSTSAW